ncbi:phage regulatory CII family protein [Paracidovorax citrulli]|uniref:phage regulatory CII family protein n=1 Tax=Paracidovorax citrulli TaxID=80869 RepID=UPI0005FB9AC1|nr:phage regulatory CII family protein [Paracidovorax citrulli]
MNSLDALRRMVANYPGGRAALAARLGKSDEVLRKELSGSSTSHKMGLADAEEIATMCHEAGSAGAQGLGTVFSFGSGMLALPVIHASAERRCLRTATFAAVQECADVFTAVTKALADGSISENDRRKVLREVGEAVAEMQGVVVELNAQYAADTAGRAPA